VAIIWLNEGEGSSALQELISRLDSRTLRPVNVQGLLVHCRLNVNGAYAASTFPLSMHLNAVSRHIAQFLTFLQCTQRLREIKMLEYEAKKVKRTNWKWQDLASISCSPEFESSQRCRMFLYSRLNTRPSSADQSQFTNMELYLIYK